MNPKTRLLILISFVSEIVTRGLRSRLLKASGIVLTANMMSGAMNFLAVIMMIRYLNAGGLRHPDLCSDYHAAC